MRKLILFFAGLILMVLMCGALVVSAAIYDSAAKTEIDTYFFQPDDSFLRRPGVPASPEDLGVNNMRERLIAKYITEYFYITPDVIDVERRMSGATSLYRMSVRTVFNAWLENIAPEIKSMAESGVLRTVSLIDASFESRFDGPMTRGEYWRITYELKTWHKPNNFSVIPETTRGVLYMALNYAPGMREVIGNRTVEEYLESGGDPAAVFKFIVIDVASNE